MTRDQLKKLLVSLTEPKQRRDFLKARILIAAGGSVQLMRAVRTTNGSAAMIERYDDDECPFEIHWEQWLPANEISPEEHLIVGAETKPEFVELYHRAWHRGKNTRADDRPEIIESVLKKMNAGYEFWHSSEVDFQDPNILIYAIEPELESEFRFRLWLEEIAAKEASVEVL
jgi:hypothetical protein